jgi:hypothetical protein
MLQADFDRSVVHAAQDSGNALRQDNAARGWRPRAASMF